MFLLRVANDFIMVRMLTERQGYYLSVHEESDIHPKDPLLLKLHTLFGKTIAVDECRPNGSLKLSIKSSAAQYLRYALKQVGGFSFCGTPEFYAKTYPEKSPQNTVFLVPTGGGTKRIQAVKTGKTFASLTSSPKHLAYEGVVNVISSSEFPQIPDAALLVRKDWFEENREVVTKIDRVIKRALGEFRDYPDVAKEKIKKFITTQYDFYDNPSDQIINQLYESMMNTWSYSGTVSPETLIEFFKVHTVHMSAHISETIVPEKFYDFSALSTD